MPDIEAIDGVAAGDVEGVNGVAKANIQAINGVGIAASGATLWVGAQDDRRIATAANSDLTSWTAYDAFAGSGSPAPSGSVDHIHCAYGKDGSGNARWVASFGSDNPELSYSDSDPTSGNNWTGVNEDSSGQNLPNRSFAVQWGNNVWIAVGKMSTKAIYRSTDGAAWALIDVSGVTGITGTGCYGLAGTGSGTVWFSQQNRIYQSTNDGTSWALLHTLLDSSNADPGDIRGLTYTNNTLVAYVKGGNIFSAASSDLTDWSDETALTNGSSIDFQARIASAAGRVVLVLNDKKWTLDVSGKSITMDSNGGDLSGDNTAHGNAESVATDGTTFVVGCATGDVFTSTDGGDSFAAAATNVGSKNMACIAPNVHLPL